MTKRNPLKYTAVLIRPKPNELQNAHNIQQCVEVYLPKYPRGKRGYDLGYKSFHAKMEKFLRSELESILNVGWQLPQKIKLSLTITEDY